MSDDEFKKMIKERAKQQQLDLENLNPRRAYQQQLKRENLKLRRAELLETLRVNELVKGDPGHFESSFDGYGDSGQYNNDSGNNSVDKLFSDMIDSHVNFDWYNNEGGGGTISWDISSDTITINGYQNIINQETMMDDEVIE